MLCLFWPVNPSALYWYGSLTNDLMEFLNTILPKRLSLVYSADHFPFVSLLPYLLSYLVCILSFLSVCFLTLPCLLNYLSTNSIPPLKSYRSSLTSSFLSVSINSFPVINICPPNLICVCLFNRIWFCDSWRGQQAIFSSSSKWLFRVESFPSMTEGESLPSNWLTLSRYIARWV